MWLACSCCGRIRIEKGEDRRWLAAASCDGKAEGDRQERGLWLLRVEEEKRKRSSVSSVPCRGRRREQERGGDGRGKRNGVEVTEVVRVFMESSKG